MSLSPQGDAAARTIIAAYVKLQEHLAQLDHALDDLVLAMSAILDGTLGEHDELLRRLANLAACGSSLPEVLEGLTLVEPALAVIRREIAS